MPVQHPAVQVRRGRRERPTADPGGRTGTPRRTREVSASANSAVERARASPDSITLGTTRRHAPNGSDRTHHDCARLRVESLPRCRRRRSALAARCGSTTVLPRSSAMVSTNTRPCPNASGYVGLLVVDLFAWSRSSNRRTPRLRSCCLLTQTMPSCRPAGACTAERTARYSSPCSRCSSRTIRHRSPTRRARTPPERAHVASRRRDATVLDVAAAVLAACWAETLTSALSATASYRARWNSGQRRSPPPCRRGAGRSGEVAGGMLLRLTHPDPPDAPVRGDTPTPRRARAACAHEPAAVLRWLRRPRGAAPGGPRGR